MSFVNFSNHSSANWSEAQLAAAREYSDVVQDLPFPAVEPNADKAAVQALADEFTNRIKSLDPSAVMCQGEFTLAYAVAERLKASGIAVMAACSERKTTETLKDGAVHKTVVFEFCRFREY
ncbi:MAG: hypothetical protein LBH21_04885 [Gracilibacteraceae bacterium]|jgi:hypothetical protein|nr:hypothetical protein [Gracilibacteraceae bacterium]